MSGCLGRMVHLAHCHIQSLYNHHKSMAHIASSNTLPKSICTWSCWRNWIILALLHEWGVEWKINTVLRCWQWWGSYTGKWSCQFTSLSIYSHELLLVTKRIRSQKQAVDVSFIWSVFGLSRRDRVRSHLEVELLLFFIKNSSLRWFGVLTRMSPGHLVVRCFCHRTPGRYLGEDPGHAGKTTCLGWVGGFATEEIQGVAEEGGSGLLCEMILGSTIA